MRLVQVNVNLSISCILDQLNQLIIKSTDGATITSAKSTVTQSWIGKTVILTCVADGVPTPVLTWKKPDGSELKKVTAMENIANADMKGDNDFGSYTCHAENGVGAAATRKVEVKQISKLDSL